MTEWVDKNGIAINAGAVVEAKGARWNVGSFRRNTLRLWRLREGYKGVRRVEEFAYPFQVEVVG